MGCPAVPRHSHLLSHLELVEGLGRGSRPQGDCRFTVNRTEPRASNFRCRPGAVRESRNLPARNQFAYCDRCGCEASLSGWYARIPARAHLKVHGPVNPEAEALLQPCQCGGVFLAGASPRCPHRSAKLSAVAAGAYLEANAPGTAKVGSVWCVRRRRTPSSEIDPGRLLRSFWCVTRYCLASLAAAHQLCFLSRRGFPTTAKASLAARRLSGTTWTCSLRA
jgi:hypothetical protein